MKKCPSTFVDYAGNAVLGDVYLCSLKNNHKGMHIDRKMRKAWAAPDLRLRQVP
jgi:hypothetical protein